ncbi:MAG: carboxypeptidase-like regulatory domain-containing protein, partial [Acidobacteriota bacterium]
MVASSPVEKRKVSKNMSRLWIILGLIIATGTTFPCRAQTVEGALRGLVVDRSGAVLPGVEVTLLNSDTNLKRLARTGMDGYYTFVLVPPGGYRLEAELGGFKKLVRRGIRLRVGDQARLDFSLEVGSLTEEITVLADVPLTQMEDPGLATVIENYQIVNLP